MSLKIFCTFVAYCAVWKTGDGHWLVWLRVLELYVTIQVATSACKGVWLLWWLWVQWWTTQLVGEHWSEEHGVGGGGGSLCLLPIVKFQEGTDIASLYSLSLWKCPLMNFLCVFLFVCLFARFFHMVNTMAIGDSFDKKGGFFWIHRPGMLFSFNLHTNSCDEVHGTFHA